MGYAMWCTEIEMVHGWCIEKVHGWGAHGRCTEIWCMRGVCVWHVVCVWEWHEHIACGTQGMQYAMWCTEMCVCVCACGRSTRQPRQATHVTPSPPPSSPPPLSSDPPPTTSHSARERARESERASEREREKGERARERERGGGGQGYLRVVCV
eukprot:572239-Rhodomonas_salina.3